MICTRRRIETTDLLIYFVFSIFGLAASRNSVFFLLAISPIVARYMPTKLYSKMNSGLDAGDNTIPPPVKYSSRKGSFNLIIAAAALFGITIHSPWIQSGVYGKSLLEPQTPVGAMNYIDEHSLEGNIFHPQIYGDYLIWRLYPKQRSFFDGRVHLFGESFARYYQKVTRDSNWESMLQKYSIDYLLLCKEGKGASPDQMINAATSSSSWVTIYEDDHSILAERREQK